MAVLVHVEPLLVEYCQVNVPPVAPVRLSVPELLTEQCDWLETSPPVGVAPTVATTVYQSEYTSDVVHALVFTTDLK